jgi:cytochrome P450
MGRASESTGPPPVIGVDGPALDPLDPSFNRDPYPLWADLRAREGLWWMDDVGAWVVLDHALAGAVLRDDEHYSPSRTYWEHYEPPVSAVPTPNERLEATGLFHVGHDDHVRLRRLVSAAFTPRGIEAQRPYLESEIDRLLDGLRPGDPFDVATGLAEPLPARVIGHMLGVRPDRTARFKKVTDRAITALDPTVAGNDDGVLDAAILEFEEVLRETIDEQRTDPDRGDHNLLLPLLDAESDGERLTEDELMSLVVTLLMAGSDTTVHAITLGVRSLLSHPDQRASLGHDPKSWEEAVTELLRYSYIGKGLVRFARRDTELDGRSIRAGAMLFVNLGSAHHDPAVFDEPDRLRLDRDLSAAFPFGVGAHYCIGAALARLEVGTAMRMLFERFPGVRAAGEPEFTSHFFLRGLAHLPVTL